MKIFVMGTGYIGEAIITLWENCQDSFFASTTTPSKLEHIEKIAEKGFVLSGKDEEHLKTILDTCDAMIVCIAPGHKSSYEETYYETAKAVSHILETRNRPFYLLYTSSTGVYGDHQGKEIREVSLRACISKKGAVLCQTEDLYLSIANSNVSCCILRLAGIYGPGRELEKRAVAMSGRKISGNGDHPMNMVHRDDVVEAISFCFKNGLTGVYNLANDCHRTRNDLYGRICKSLSLPPPIFDAQEASDHGSNGIVLSSKLREKGYVFKHPQES